MVSGLRVEARRTLGSRHSGEAPELDAHALQLAGEASFELEPSLGARLGASFELGRQRICDLGLAEGYERHGLAQFQRGRGRVEAGFAVGQGVFPRDGHAAPPAGLIALAPGLVTIPAASFHASRSGTTSVLHDATRAASFSTLAATSSNNKNT